MIGLFGPIGIDPIQTLMASSTTPKPNWADVDIVGAFRRFECTYLFHNRCEQFWAYGEVVARNNAGGHIENPSLLYNRFRIGAGVIQRGEFIGELTEMGHHYGPNTQWMWKKNSRVSSFPQWLFGRFCGWSQSLRSSYGYSWENIELNSNVWDIQVYYIAQAAVNATVTFRPDVIVFGGGVMAQQHMLDRVRNEIYCLERLPVPDGRDYIVTPAVAGNGSATLGTLSCKRSERKA